MPDLTEAESTVLDMLAKSSTPWMRRSMADLVAGRGIVDGLERAKLIQFWATKAVNERRKNQDGSWSTVRDTPTTFVALTALGHTVTSRDVFERSDCGVPYQAPRRKSEAGAWVLPDTPVKSQRGGGAANLCPDILPADGRPRTENGPKTRKQTRREEQAKKRTG